jgi:hypothetical protein
MQQRVRIVLGLLVAFALFWAPPGAFAQGVTTGSIAGIVKDAQGLAVPGSTVVAVHEPSGTTYEAVTREDGRFSIPGMRVGGPYTVTASLEGFQPQVTKDVYVNLGVAADLTLTLKTLAVSEEVTVVAQSDAVFSSTRTGAATAISRETLASLPTLSNRLGDFTRLTPQAAGTSFGGVDNRLNNITVDGSYFNNSFGLAGSPGDRTGVAPISLSAIEAVQVNIAPYDVRQGNFIGAGVNTVTRSGGNAFRGSAFYQWKNDSLVGTEAKGLVYNPGTFDFHNTGGWFSGPIVKNKLFFFFNFEDEANTYPGTTYRANNGGETVAGNTTRVLASDLQALSSFMKSKFNYETGPYQDYQFETPARRYLFRGDYNLNSTNKVSFRYNQLDSNTDVLLSNSSSLGWGTRRSNLTGLNFEASNYQIKEDILSFIGEWNGAFGGNMANTLIMGYTKQDESRDVRYPTLFPFIDILGEGTTVYTSLGYEPFTPNNELRYNTFQLQDNFSVYLKGHSLTFGGSYENYRSENVFFPGKQSAYVYNSLGDFYTDMNDYLANPNRTTSPITLRRFQVRWNNIPGSEKPLQPLEVQYFGAYAQDVWQWKSNFSLTYGLRFDVPVFGDTGYANAVADAMTFRDEDGQPVQYSTAKLPDPKILWSPRVGFNWDVFNNRNTQVRGGTGIFTGKPAYVWISNQIGNTGVLTGFEQLDNTTARPFNPNTERYKPASVTGAPASSFELALTDPNFKFPQVWRTSIGVDQRLPGGWVGTLEYIYSQDVNGLYYINANLPAPSSAYVGADARPRWTAGNRINSSVANAVVLKNQNVGTNWNISGSLERTYRNGLYLKGGYRYGRAWNTVDPGSIAFGSWNNNQHSGNPNNPGVAYSASSPGHRVFAAGTYTFEWLKALATSVSVVFEGYTGGQASYTFSADANGDGGTSNDLIYIPRDQSEMNFQQYSITNGPTFSAAEQAAAWEAYIQQDEYLSKHRGEFAVRGAVFLPMVFRTDLSVSQDVFKNIAGRRNTLQFRVDVANFGNLLNSDWGVGQRLINAQPLTNPSADSSGRMQYRLRAVNNKLMTTSLESTAGFSDVYSVMFSLRYQF